MQKYIERPLLIGGRKFDIRSYVLLTPDHKVYMFRESYVRTSSTPFDIANLADRWVRWCTMGDGPLACTSLPCRLVLGVQGAAVCCQAGLQLCPAFLSSPHWNWPLLQYTRETSKILVRQMSEGFKRLCAAPAGASQVADVKLRLPCRSAHLTNDAVQINFDNYGSFEDANKLTMEALQELFAGQVGLALAAGLTQGLRSRLCLTPHTVPHHACWTSSPGQATCQDSKQDSDPLCKGQGTDWISSIASSGGWCAAQPRGSFAVCGLLPCR